MSSQPQIDRAGGFGTAGSFGTAGYRDSYDDPPHKRQRMSIDLTRRSIYEQEPQLSQRAFMQTRDPLAPMPPRDLQPMNRGSYYSQGTGSTSSSVAADYTFGHQRTNSSSTSSPFISPRNEYPGYSFSTPTNTLYQQSTRDPVYHYPQSQYTDPQSRQVPQLSQPVPPYRPVPSSVTSQSEQSRPYSRPYDNEMHTPTDRGYGSINSVPRLDYYTSQQPSQLYDRHLQPLARTLPDPSQPLTSVLPPLQSTLPSSQPRRDPPQAYSSGGGSSMEGLPQLQSSMPSNQENQGYLPHSYRGSQNG